MKEKPTNENLDWLLMLGIFAFLNICFWLGFSNIN